MIRVLVVDDLFFMRTLISDLLAADPEIKVCGTAKDGEEAFKKIAELKPDVVTLDLSMPEMDGQTALQEIMNRFPTPVVMLSAHESQKEADVILKCLNSGAVSFVLKPSGEMSLDIEKIKPWLLREVKAAASVDIKKIKTLFSPKPPLSARKLAAVDKLIIIGASTGGPQSLEILLSSLPADFPASILVVQHVPSLFFTRSLVNRLNKACQLEVEILDSRREFKFSPTGRIYLIPFSTATEGQNSPSIDETMLNFAGENVLGIILSGIGKDGLKGMQAIKEKGGKTIVQDESALIFGMPKAVIDAGCADQILSLEEISKAMVEFVEDPERAERVEG